MPRKNILRNSVLTVAIASVLAMGGCASAPAPVIPGGSHRTPINAPDKIEDYKARTAQETANYNERTALRHQVDSLNWQVAELKTHLVMLQMDTAANPAKARPISSAATPGQLSSKASESIEVRDQKIVLNITYPQGKTDFKPSPKLLAQLKQAARAGKHIEIHGRTDGQPDYLTDRDITLRRALRAREVMFNNGLDPSRMQWSYRETNQHLGRIE